MADEPEADSRCLDTAHLRPPMIHRPAWRMLAWATLVFAPLVAASIVWSQPFMASTLASTAAVALNAPDRFEASWSRVVIAYALAALLSISMAAALHSAVPSIAWATAASVLIIASSAGRVHAPTACFPFGLIGSGSTSSLLAHFWIAVGGVIYVLVLLRLPWRAAADQSPTEPAG